MDTKPRARDLGIPLEGKPGPYNSITDVDGVEVGMTTLIEGESCRTGVTVIHPRGKTVHDPVFAAWFPSTATADDRLGLGGGGWLPRRPDRHHQHP
jgi:L-aminopeptidase/D-esterase-like protein